jgi:predicted 2-oxoglutarate/Fe(II)-dependent dioxygenase YbiX
MSQVVVHLDAAENPLFSEIAKPKNVFADLIKTPLLFVKSDVGTLDSETREMDLDTRIAQHVDHLSLKFSQPPPSTNNFQKLLCHVDGIFEELEILSWSLCKYETGGFFKKHADGPRAVETIISDEMKKHLTLSSLTVLLFPPGAMNPHEGGKLQFYEKDYVMEWGGNTKPSINRETYRLLAEFSPSEFESWTLIFFPHEMIHECTPVTKGTRYVFKSRMYKKLKVDSQRPTLKRCD